MSEAYFFVVFVNLIIALVVIRVLVMIVRLSANKFLGINTKPLSRPGSGGKRFLILGDSTAVGTGAKDQADTIAGRLAYDFPKAEIVNLGINGGLVRDLNKQVEQIEGQMFDLIIVSAGGNDVWHLTRISSIVRTLSSILPKLTEMSNGRTLFLIYNNIGSAPLFPAILGGFLKRRCIRVQDAITEVTYDNNVAAIELFNEDGDNPFVECRNGVCPKDLFAVDGIHPSSDGYRLWYNRIWRTIRERGYKL